MKKVTALCLAVMLLSLTVVSALALGENMTMFVNTQDHKPLKLRSGEGQNYSVLLKIDFGQPVQVVENRGTWSAVTYNGVHGYVMTKFLSFYKPSGTPAPKYTPQPIPVPVPVPVPVPTMQPYIPTDMNTIFRTFVKVNPYTAYACPQPCGRLRQPALGSQQGYGGHQEDVLRRPGDRDCRRLWLESGHGPHDRLCRLHDDRILDAIIQEENHNEKTACHAAQPDAADELRCIC